MKINSLILLWISFLVPFISSSSVHAQENPVRYQPLSDKQAWVDSVYGSLTEQERIGQLFMVAAYSGGTNYNKTQIVQLIKAHQIGGIIFMQGTPQSQAQLTNEYQKMAQVPLLIGMDGEWGLGMRLTGVKDYPLQMLLGATDDTALVKQMGAEIAAQCKRLGVHIDFAPDVDVNNNPDNPVINFRSFGEDKHRVARLGIAYMKGLQEHGIIACAKHFPGHGDVSVDSHKDLPVIDKSREEIDTLELYPFKQLIQAGIKSVMVAHLSVPALEQTPHLPTTLSRKVVTDLLRDSLGFQGLIITDALNMQGVTKYYPEGEADLLAFLAGNDILLFSQDVPLAIQKIESAIREGKASEQDLAKRVKKILAAKYDAGLNHFQPIDTDNLLHDLNQSTQQFWEKAAEESITLVKDKHNLLQQLNRPQASIAHLAIDKNIDPGPLNKLLQERFPHISEVSSTSPLDNYDVVIVSIRNLNRYPGASGSYGLTSQEITLINKLAQRDNVCFVVFGNAYLMKYLCDAGTVLMAYEDHPATEAAAVKALSGALIPRGTLPVTSCTKNHN